MNKNILYNTFIIGFLILYIATALISLFHAIEFFQIGNERWMAITLASVFELGQMVVLSSLLLSDNKKALVAWLLLIILTCVQVIGNVYSVFKYISLSGTDYYIYLQKSLIDLWLKGVAQDTIMVIISWIIGALLPVIALFMTSMVANNIQLKNTKRKDDKLEETPKLKKEIVNTPDIIDTKIKEDIKPIVEKKDVIPPTPIVEKKDVIPPTHIVEKKDVVEEKKEETPSTKKELKNTPDSTKPYTSTRGTADTLRFGFPTE
jgi:hypothetical protein